MNIVKLYTWQYSPSTNNFTDYNQTWLVLGLGLWCLMPLSTIFIGGGNWSAWENHRPRAGFTYLWALGQTRQWAPKFIEMLACFLSNIYIYVWKLNQTVLELNF